MEEIKDRKDYSKVLMSDGVAVLEGTASWCSQCKAIKPFVDKLIKKYPDAKFYNYDVDNNPDVAQELGVNQMPTFHSEYFSGKNGQVDREDGDVESSVTGAKGSALESAIKDIYKGNVEEIDTSS